MLFYPIFYPTFLAKIKRMRSTRKRILSWAYIHAFGQQVRRGAILALLLTAALSDRCFADDQTSFIVDMTHAFYVSVSCPGFEIVNNSFVASAKAKDLKPEIVDQVRNGVVFLNSAGKNGLKPPKPVMDSVILAAKMVALDFQEVGVKKWCDHRTKFLLKNGFVARSNQ